jgi:hypothetical protein
MLARRSTPSRDLGRVRALVHRGVRADKLPTEGAGHVIARGPFALNHIEEILRRVRNVSGRARAHDAAPAPIAFGWTPEDVHIRTPSHRLAHRIARELLKSYAGRARYHWDDRDGALLVIWERSA